MDNRCLQLLDAIVHYKMAHDGCSPTVAWLVNATDITSTNIVAYHLRHLRDWGYISFPDGQPRSIQVVGGEWRIADDDE